jgi:hypothetical protein
MAVDNAAYDFRKDLVRNVITEPLYSDILADSSAIATSSSMSTSNHEGRMSAFVAVVEFAKRALGGKENPNAGEMELPKSVGSSSNPFMSARLPGFYRVNCAPECTCYREDQPGL